MLDNEEQDYFIKKIKSSTVVYGDGWANGKTGCFEDLDSNYLLRFVETDKNGNYYLIAPVSEREKLYALPILSCGFVAWLIKHWGENTTKIYSEYLQTELNQHEAEQRNDADVFKRDLEREFYGQYRAKEEQRVKQSEAIFDFISNHEKNLINDYVQNYFEYVKTKENENNKMETKNIKEGNYKMKSSGDIYVNNANSRGLISLIFNKNQRDKKEDVKEKQSFWSKLLSCVFSCIRKK